MNKIITKYRVYRINNSLEASHAAFDYLDKKTNKYFDFTHEAEAFLKVQELNSRVENPEIEFWYRAIEV